MQHTTCIIINMVLILWSLYTDFFLFIIFFFPYSILLITDVLFDSLTLAQIGYYGHCSCLFGAVYFFFFLSLSFLSSILLGGLIFLYIFMWFLSIHAIDTATEARSLVQGVDNIRQIYGYSMGLYRINILPINDLFRNIRIFCKPWFL
ncbi:hypothetical protein P175DRAFT_0206499 [Aspergillus ochraceoroseus IBT 24754]|uniref:Uncharacterized protein n=1 Tax=Aspergillus ochraceoroseus IBT 24754 TaxID=1392256 RepID=A0A2T5M062_9EURO|nr:uncharacterized protein P175DRAFT_0206499 [Aspergillus ochraceoroseus IBT 24754]PTU21920.1 hypothetical protein P175DRAFT_0206499 [Aspergillus ochraceoroseus IBT 24754]